jgi:branched-chain amino acid transport system ATP-binding protein
MALLELTGVHTGYGSTRVLWGLNLRVERGEVVALLGPNGAGKTTIASVIAGALKTWSGTITFDGTDMTTAGPEHRARAGITHVPQGRRVFPDLTVEENILVALNAAGSRAKPETRDFVHDLFPKLSILARRAAGSLSGGEQQMLVVARALVAEPSVIVFDEPSLGLAPVVVQDMYQSLHRIRERGISSLLIEQMVGPALGVADRVLVLESGAITASGTPAEFRDNNELAARYLGSDSGQVERQ